jgi:hypothetical protein
MPLPDRTRDLARSLVVCEADASKTTLRARPATVRVYEALRRQLGSTMGVDGFQVVAARALALAQAQAPRLNAAQVAANGALRGLEEIESPTDADREAGIALIAQLLGLFLTFLGEATTLRLIDDLHLQADIPAEPAATAADAVVGAAADGPATTAFGDLLVDIEQLRSVGEHIAALAAQYPGMEEGLLSVAGNIHSIATVLDVFTLIKSKAGGRLQDALLPPADGYVH